VEDAERFEEKSKGNSMPWEMEGVYKQSLEKTKAFKKWVEENKENAVKMLESCVFFCKTKAQGESIADVLVGVLHFSKHHQYYSSEIAGQASDPKDVLEKFKSGELTTLITAGKLDQGFDMPELKNVVLMESDASDFSKKRRKLVQRIGRMLRIDPENEAKRGFVLDFVRLIKDDDYLESSKNHEDEDRNKPLLSGISIFDLDRSTWLQEVSKIKKVKKDD
jgi:superfamily II DNA or RNA helicase